MAEKLESLAERIEHALSASEIDADTLRRIADEAEASSGAIAFTVDATLVSRLGRELVGKQETAVAELVKNAYDADASFVKLYFDDVERPGGTLRIIDDGNGMSLRELRGGFMRLSTDDKVEHPVSPRFGRTRAGRKGIGRFAVQRLGRSLRLTTQTDEGAAALTLEIDWETFVAGRELGRIKASLDQREKERDRGTTLEIGGLREGWSEASLKRVFRYLNDLIQPFPLSKRVSRGGADPGFKAEIFRRSKDASTTVVDVRSEVLDLALAQIEAYVDSEGRGVWSVRSDQLGINEPVAPLGAEEDSPNAPFLHLRDVHVVASYFIYRAGYLPRSQEKTVRDLASTQGGIRIYRNGFRVRPYGDPADDWLRLDESTGGRSILPPHANKNFIGFVEVVDPEGTQFEETSSREGLIENEAFAELLHFARRALTSAVLRVAAERGRKQKTKQEGWEPESVEPDTLLAELVDELTSLGETVPDLEASQVQARIATAVGIVRKAVRARERIHAELLAELGMLRVLASLGLVIGEFTHEVRQTVGAAFLSARQLSEMLPHGSDEQTRAVSLVSSVDRFRSYIRYFDSTIAESARRELLPVDLSSAASDFVRAIRPIAERLGVKHEELEVVGPDAPITRAMHPSEVSSVLSNLFSNATKAIRRTGQPGKVRVRVGTDEDVAFIEFLDTGDGIPARNRERVFDAFFTTSTAALDDDEVLSGSGLGLKIVRDIARAYGGDAYVADPPDGFATAVRFEIPKGGDDDVE